MAKIVGFTSRQKIDHQQELITRRCRGLMSERGITQKVLAEYVDMAEITISKQFQNGKLSLPVLIGILILCKANEEDKERIMKIKE